MEYKKILDKIKSIKIKFAKPKSLKLSAIIILLVCCAATGGLTVKALFQKKANQAVSANRAGALCAMTQLPLREIAEEIKDLQEAEAKAAAEAAARAEAERLAHPKKTERERVYVELTDANRENFVKVASCEISPGTGNFVLSGSANVWPVSDDDFFYLMEMKLYEMTLNPESEPIASVPKGLEFSLTAAVNENKPDSRLFSKFVVAVKLEGEYVPLSSPHFMTNPEALAAYKSAFPESDSIKGLLVDPLKLGGNELNDLGVKHAAYNILISNILGPTTNSLYPTIYYTYNGRKYAFNGQRIAEYDIVFRTLTAKGITTTAILLNNKSAAQPQLIHPLSRDGSAYYYAFNTTDDNGIETMAAVGAFLSHRYRDREHGIVMNWVVGNEVNVRQIWNYMQYVDLDTYTREYANAVRVFYNSIKSMNANARIYVPMDQQWNCNSNATHSYDAKDMLISMNGFISSEGNIDWGLAYHPYAYPLTNTTFWASPSKMVTNSENTKIVTMENINVITDFLQKPEMLTRAGEVRPVILSELGYSSTAGEANQAAAFAYAYYAAAQNPHIDALILSRQTDAAEEVAQGLAVGLSTQGGSRKYIYEVYKHIDKADGEAYTEFAKEIIGIHSWSEVAK